MTELSLTGVFGFADVASLRDANHYASLLGRSMTGCSIPLCTESHLLREDRLHRIFFRPAGQEKERKGPSAQARPVDALYLSDAGRPEIERASVEQDDTPTLVHFPKSASVGATVTVSEQVAVKVHVSELQDTVLIDDEFLVHSCFW